MMLKVKICLVIMSLVCIAGFQTIGEEYVNIIQVDETFRSIPSRLVSIISIPKIFPMEWNGNSIVIFFSILFIPLGINFVIFYVIFFPVGTKCYGRNISHTGCH